MFSRVVELAVKSGKTNELSKTFENKVLPLLKVQPGFVDEITLFSESDPSRVLAISFWRTKQEVERYNRDQYPKIKEMVSPLLETTPTIEYFDVDTSTVHKIAAGRAA